jgi:hypothetical protein
MRTPHLLLAVCLMFVFSAVASAQRGPQTQKMSGKLKEIQQKGRAATLVVVTEDGTEHEFPLTPRVDFEVTAPGDAGFVRPGQFLAARGVLTNNTLFIKDLKIHLVGPGQRPPVGRVQKAPAQAGQSENAFDISGAIVAWEFELLPRWALLVLAGREAFMLLLTQIALRRGMDLKVIMLGLWAVWPA